MKLGRILLSLGLVAFAAAAGASGIDRLSYRSPGVERLVPRPFRAQADRSAAAIALSRQERSLGVAHARAAVAHDPVDRDSAALLGSALLVSGDDDGAAAAFRIAARFGWRNVATQLYWYQAALQADELSVAMDRADALLRTHPAFEQRDAMLAPLEENPAARPLLIDHLLQRPAWLDTYLTLSDGALEDLVDRRVEVISDQKWAGHPIGCLDIAQFARSLLDRSRRAEAEAVWNLHCPERRVTGYLTDSDFASVAARGPDLFAWRIRRSGDVIVRSETGSNDQRVLVLRNSASATQQVMYQALALPRGTYRLRLTLADGEPASEAARLSASFGCNGSAPFPQVRGEVAGQGLNIEVGDCRHQVLALWLGPGAGEVRLRSAALDKLD